MTNQTNNPCEGCGLCCMNQPCPPFKIGPVFEVQERTPPGYPEQNKAFVFSPRCRDGDPCIWLDRPSGLCLHYDDRPEICREFRVGCEDCNRMRAKAKLKPIETNTTRPGS